MSDDSNNPLPKVVEGRIGGDLVPTVNARELHACLGVGRVFAAWIVERILAYGFNENSDFVVFSENGNNPYGGRPSKEYALTLDMAKEIAMVERNEIGQRVRRYFIECERIAKSRNAPAAPAIVDLSDQDAVLKALVEQAQGHLAARKRAAEAEAQLAISAPKVDFYDRYAEADGVYNLRNAGRVLGQGPQKFIDSLKGRYLHYEGGALVPYSHHRNKGWFSVKAHLDGDGKARPQTYMTPKGIVHFAKGLGVSPDFSKGAPAPEFDFGTEAR